MGLKLTVRNEYGLTYQIMHWYNMDYSLLAVLPHGGASLPTNSRLLRVFFLWYYRISADTTKWRNLARTENESSS